MRRWLMRGVLMSFVVFMGAIALSTGCATFGGDPEGARLTRMQASPHFADGVFHNAAKTPEDTPWSAMWEMLTGDQQRRPEHTLPLVTQPLPERAAAHRGLRITWMGHSSVLIESNGRRVLTDPVWGERVSPSSIVGPSRFHAPPLALETLGKLDAVVISHDHYDHLDHPTILQLAKTDVPFVVPLGVGAHLEHWGVPADRIVELDWWERWTSPTGVTLVATPAQHFSGRGLLSRNSTLWASWVVRTDAHRVYFGGDTGLFPGFADIGRIEGPFDAALMPIGAYNDAWAAIHLNPEEAVAAHQMVNGGLFIPIHWGTFNLAIHDWYEPVERLLKAAQAAKVRVAIPRAGESVDPAAPQAVAHWWREKS